ncbi:MAG: hypothetical protein H6983_07895 [Ectothiorhodospiraceae bacterium]|nr:hypothetical protein [Chromatiales bacterium]MCP5154069.1 hypothetical protein [Ectothiorhodospiraceae bacterium]
MKTHSIRAALAAAVVGLATATSVLASEVERMLVTLTSADTEAQAMALVLSNQVAAGGTAVHLLLCSAAGDIALSTPPAAATRVVTPTGMTVRGLLEALMAKGARVDVCAIYLPNRGLDPKALATGIGVAKPPAIAAEMVDSGVRLASF